MEFLDMDSVGMNKHQQSRQRKALLFGNSTGHGITMTAISERALACGGYDVETICRYVEKLNKDPETGTYPQYCGTGQTEFFWGRTFPCWDFSALERDDVVMIVHLPLPIQQRIQEYSASDAGIEIIRNLCQRGIRVILVDHHSRTVTDYGKAVEAGAEFICSVGPVRYAHYGMPDDFTLFWGSIGAICDRDGAMAPLEDDEKELLARFEGYADWLDDVKEFVGDTDHADKDPLEVIRADDRKKLSNFDKPFTIDKKRIKVCENVSFVENLTPKKGLKELDYACSVNNTPYGVGIGNGIIQVINYWKLPSTPVTLLLHRYRKRTGHDTGITIPVSEGMDPRATADEFISILKSRQQNEFGTIPENPDVIDHLIQAFAKSRIQIPEWLTIHGWAHVQKVFANVQLLGTLFNCNEHDQRILNWSALFHDIGNAALNYKDNSDYQLTREYLKDSATVRKYHHCLTVEILKCWRRDGLGKGKDGKPDLISDIDFTTICELCLFHRKAPKFPDDPHNKMLCAILRIADALDKTKERARINDRNQLWSQVLKDLLKREQNQADPEDGENARISRINWESQRSIETIRLYIRKQDQKNTIFFEFLVTDKAKADFAIKDFEAELNPLREIKIDGIGNLEVRFRRVPLFS